VIVIAWVYELVLLVRVKEPLPARVVALVPEIVMPAIVVIDP